MNLKEIHRVLKETFQKELTNGRNRHIVFWYDEEGEFLDDIDDIRLENVRIWKLTKNNLFATKYELEVLAPTSHFLIYANMVRPKPREDWLLDIYKVATEFATDKITVIMRELGITDDSLGHLFKQYKTFFNNKARLQAFSKFLIEHYTEETIDLTVLASICKSKGNTMDEIVKKLMKDEQLEGNPTWEDVRKYGNEEKFWFLVEKYYGYSLKERTIKSLIIFFMLTHLSQHNADLEFPETWKGYISERPANIIVFMDQWMNHREERHTYNKLADEISSFIHVNNYTKAWDIHDMMNLDTFRIFDKKILRYLVEQLTNNLNHFDSYLEITSKRRRLHWYSVYHYEYEAVRQAVQLLKLTFGKTCFIPEQSSYEMFQSYSKEYYLLDTAYRKFYVAYDQIEQKENMLALRERVENVYSYGYIAELSIKWMTSLEQANHKNWPITGIMQQKNFFQTWVQPYLANKEKVFVIVSDAMRYEVAYELMEFLNNERKASTEITAIQAALPSYTDIGMASLLPHQQMTFHDANVVVDGIRSSSTLNRNQLLRQTVSDALVVQYQDVIAMNQTALREMFVGKKVVYIYHNTIDARGDHAATEMEVFSASEEAIRDIRLLVNQLVQNVSASNILVTSDHGFIYQRDPITHSQKIPQEVNHALLAKRRFIVSEEFPKTDGTLTYSMDYLFKQDCPLFVTVPKGINRFAIQGVGANFVHGGAMLQEIVIPVITFKNDRSKSLDNAVKKVDVKLITQVRKITNMMMYLEFFQVERIENKKLPLHLNVYFEDDQGERISNKNVIIADHISTKLSERTFREKFVFKNLAYERHRTYYLVLEDEDKKNDAIYERYSFTIDITTSNDFNF